MCIYTAAAVVHATVHSAHHRGSTEEEQKIKNEHQMNRKKKNDIGARIVVQFFPSGDHPLEPFNQH